MGFAAALKLGDKDGIFVNRLVEANSFQPPSSSWRGSHLQTSSRDFLPCGPGSN